MPEIEPPYPADLEAKGWSLDLDYEKIEQSDTWVSATSKQRPWLLMVWLIAWRQVPIASFTPNDKLIAARIGLSLERFLQWKDVLLSGFELANDGRIYHRTLVACALRMASKRDKDRARVASFRAKSAVSNDDVAACNALPTRDQRVSSTPSPSPLLTPTEKQKKKTVSKKGLLTLSDWMIQNPDPDYSAVYTYAEKIGLPPAFLDVAFFEFAETFSGGGTNAGKKYADWKLVVLKYLRGNWLKLWYQDESSKEWRLNTAGIQAQAAMLASAVQS